jgi:hypothetical protein
MPLQSKKSRRIDPDFTSAINSELIKLEQLKPNWDGYGALALDRAIIAAAKTFIARLPENLAPRPRVVPMSPGNLQFEWHDGPKVLELEFETAEAIHYLQYDPDKGVEEEDVFPAADVDKAIDLIQWFMSGTCT